MTNPISARKGTPVAEGCGVRFEFSATIATVTIGLAEIKTVVSKEWKKTSQKSGSCESP